jgi:hypothetical protein
MEGSPMWIKVSRSVFRTLLPCLCLLGVVITSYLLTFGRLRFLHPESRLGIFETRIENVSTEFMRRSPQLKKNFEEFKSCMQMPDCNSEEILAKRDAIIQKEWPVVFDRLLVEDDWGSLAFTDMAHDRLVRETARVGGKAIMRSKCVPLIRYYHKGNQSYYRQYEKNGYRCN